SPDELMDLDLAGERQHAGRQCAGEGRRRRGCCWIWISPARGSTQGGSAQGKEGDAGVVCWIWISPARGSTQGGSAQGKRGDAGVANGER
ncbi:hypothetical protein U1Q18_021088, partial [Sarracenia purpurea var. burkii]